MDALERIVENPFLGAVLITLALSFIFYSFIAQYITEMPSTKVMIKAFIYMYLTTLLFFYLHSKTVKKFYESSINSKIHMSTFNRNGSSELEVKPDAFARGPQPQQPTANYTTTNEFV